MLAGGLALVVAIGLTVSLIRAYRVMNAAPLLGGDAKGYADSGPSRSRKTFEARQRTGWRLIVAGFVIQLAAVLATAVVAFMTVGE